MGAWLKVFAAANRHAEVNSGFGFLKEALSTFATKPATQPLGRGPAKAKSIERRALLIVFLFRKRV